MILRSLAHLPSSLNLSESSYICFMYNVQGFHLYFAGKMGKIMSIPSSWKQNSLKRVFSYLFIIRHETLLIKSPTLLSYERIFPPWTSVLPIMLKKRFCLNKIILRENILEGLFTRWEHLISHFLFYPLCPYPNFLAITTLLFPEAFWFEFWESLVALSCLLFKLLDTSCS